MPNKAPKLWSMESYLAARDDKLTTEEIRILGAGSYLARFAMTRQGSSKDTCKYYAMAKLVIHIHAISEPKNGVADITYSYTGLRSSEEPERPVLHVRNDGIIPPESFAIDDPVHGKNLISVEGYLRLYERTLEDLLELSPPGTITLPS